MGTAPLGSDFPFLAAIAETLLLNSQAGIVVFEGRTGDCLLANQVVADLTGGDMDALRRQNFRRLHSFRESRLDAVVEMVLADGTPRRHETIMLTSFGQFIAFDCYVSRFVFEGTQYVVLVLSDITLRMQAEQALGVREKELRTLVETIPICIARYDRELRRIYMNRSLETISGLRPEQYIGFPAGEFPQGTELETPVEYLKKLSTVLRTGTSQKLEFPWRNARAEELYLECTLIPEYDRAGAISGVLSVASDLTERMHLEAELLRARELAEAASLVKSEFLATMSHEIRTPLNGISGMLQLLGFTQLNEEQQEYLQAARQSSTRLARLLADILDFSYAVSGRLKLLEGPLEISLLQDAVLETFQEPVQDKGLSLEVHIGADMPPVVLGDAKRLRQILFQLLDNALKFTDHGGIRVELWPTHVRDGAMRALFVVHDTGIGISDRHLDIIFQPFVQGDGSYARKFQGAGIGLSIVVNLVALMGGTLAIESAEEAGTTVYVSVPLRLPAQERPAADQAKPLEAQDQSFRRSAS